MIKFSKIKKNCKDVVFCNNIPGDIHNMKFLPTFSVKFTKDVLARQLGQTLGFGKIWQNVCPWGGVRCRSSGSPPCCQNFGQKFLTQISAPLSKSKFISLYIGTRFASFKCLLKFYKVKEIM